MISAIEHLRCTGCAACYNRCPTRCIAMETDDEGFLYPIINNKTCVKCGLCDLTCPILHNPVRSKQTQNVFAAQNQDTVLRKQSSSGGVFSLLAEKMIQKGGAVFGAAFDEDCYSVNHIAITDKKELDRLRLSKYLQSNKKSTYSEAEELLKKGRKVLFSGTPCEIAALKSFLGREYDNLLCVDLVCHGVPSQKIWENHLKSIEEHYNGKVTKVNFRDKTHHIKHQKIIHTKTGRDILFSQGTDPFMLLFLRNYSLRPSCYCCKFKDDNYCSDITLGDFWGIGTVFPEMQDGLGTSLVITRTEQGVFALHEIESLLFLKRVDLSAASRNNTALVEPVKEPQERSYLFHLFQNGDMNEIQKYVSPRRKSISERVAGTRVGLLFLSIKHRRIFRSSETDFCVRYTINPEK